MSSIDVFEINEGDRCAPSEILKKVVENMSMNQLKALIVSGCTPENLNTLYNLASLILSTKKPAESSQLLTEMTKHSFFVKAFLRNWEQNSYTKPPDELNVDKELAYHYLINLLNDSTVHRSVIHTFLRNVQWHSTGTHCNTSPLEDQTFLDRMTHTQKKELCALYAFTKWSDQQLYNSLLISKNLMVEFLIELAELSYPFNNYTYQNQKLYDHIEKKEPGSGFEVCKIAIKKCDDKLISWWFRRLSDKSVITDLTFIKTLTKNELLMVAGALIFNSISISANDHDNVITCLSTDPSLAAQFIKDNIDRWIKLAYLSSVYNLILKFKSLNSACFDAIAAALTSDQKNLINTIPGRKPLIN